MGDYRAADRALDDLQSLVTEDLPLRSAGFASDFYFDASDITAGDIQQRVTPGRCDLLTKIGTP